MEPNLKPKRLFGVLLCCAMLLALLPAAALAERTTVLNLNASEFATDQANAAEGWSWNAATSTLTLTNATFTTNGSGIIFPNDRDSTLCLVGENTITCPKNTLTDATAAGRPSQAYKVTITGDGKLTATTTGNLPTFDLSNYVQESGTVVTTGGIATLSGIKVSGGSLSVDASGSSFWPHGLYACGSIEITGGTVDVKAKGAGGAGLVVTGTGAVDPQTGLLITGGDVTIETGMAATFIGVDCRKDTIISTTGSVTVNSPIGFYSGQGDIAIEKGDIVLENVTRPVGHGQDAGGNQAGDTNIASADYSQVDAAITKAEALNKDHYKNYDAVTAARAAVARNKYYFEQDAVDGYAAAIENAINALEYKDADYSGVDAAIAKAKALNQADYKDFSAVEAAIGAVVRGKLITEQAEVDAMASAIADAIAALEKNPAASAPNTPSTGEAALPRTGDSGSPFLWMALMLASCTGLLGAMVYRRRRTSK